ncbi:MAG: molybdopterin-binding protein [Desulfobacteraceae bacterium]
MGSGTHKTNTPKNLNIAVISASSTRREPAEDKSGIWIKNQAKKEGHEVVIHRTVPDDRDSISELVTQTTLKIGPDIIIITGGTGIARKDVTIEAVQPLFSKTLTAFGPLFAQLSFEQIDSAAILSRAAAGIIDSTVVFCIPGSLNACKLACRELIFPELGHLVKHIRE